MIIYNYTDENYKMLYQTIRKEPKSFLYRHLNRSGNWEYNLKNIRRIPYNLPILLRNNKICIVEGEKDANTLMDYGIPSTTCCCGVNGWEETYNKYFIGKEVCIIPDNDKPGFLFAKNVAINIFPYANSVKIILLPNLDEKQDITDWLDGIGDVKELFALMENSMPLKNDDIENYKMSFKKEYTVVSEIHTRNMCNDKLKNALNFPIEKLIYVHRNGRALCVNHEETNPSMDTRRGFCYCYSCGWSGNVIQLYMKIHDCNFSDAVNDLNRLMEMENEKKNMQ